MKNMDTNFYFDLSDDYNEQFRKYVKVLNTKSKLHVEDKCKIAKELIETYVRTTGERPDAYQLDRLSSWLLKYENLNGDFKSERQLIRIQQEKEVLSEFVEDDDRHMRHDGNRFVGIKPVMDSEETHKIRVRLPSDKVDKRQFNGPLEKYFLGHSRKTL